MAWLSTSDLRNKFSIQPNKYEPQLESAISDAGLRIRAGVTSDIYTEAVGVDLEDNDANYFRQQSVIQAHAYLTMWYLVGNVGNKLGDTGFIKEAQDSASPAMGSRIITNRYLTPQELKVMRDEYLENARVSLGDYGVITVVIEEPITEQQQLGMSSLPWL